MIVIACDYYNMSAHRCTGTAPWNNVSTVGDCWEVRHRIGGREGAWAAKGGLGGLDTGHRTVGLKVAARPHLVLTEN